jgi:hypothetical protein
MFNIGLSTPDLPLMLPAETQSQRATHIRALQEWQQQQSSITNQQAAVAKT